MINNFTWAVYGKYLFSVNRKPAYSQMYWVSTRATIGLSMIRTPIHLTPASRMFLLRAIGCSVKPHARQGVDRGLTLIELLVVIVILGLLAAIATPPMFNNIERARVAATASEMKSFADGIYSYALLTGAYPNDSHNAIPPGTDGYINTTAFLTVTPLGGNYNWEGPDTYPYAGVSLFNSPADNRILLLLDETLDDGNLAGGNFRLGTNGRPTLIVEECASSPLC